MVIYEVNIDIHRDIFNDYYLWLMEHIKEMLTFAGFQKAEIGLIEQEDESIKKIRVSYTIASYGSLQHYFAHHAPQMRAKAANKFGDKFNAHRRIIKDAIIVEA